MSTVGLTKAQDRALRDFYHASPNMLTTLHDLGLINSPTPHTDYTPRGHAALAAPRMTQAELALLELMERSSHAFGWIVIGSTKRRTAQRLRKSGLAEFDCADCWNGRLNAAGRTALNNVRAAMGSPDWKDYDAMDYASSYSESAP